MTIVYEFGHATGGTIDQMSCVVNRWSDQRPFGRDNGESFAAEFVNGQNLLNQQYPAHFTGCFRTDAGTVFLPHFHGRMLMRPAGMVDRWDAVELAPTLYGVWGLDEEHVWAWGDRGGTPVMFRWDGTAWSECSSPPGHVNAMHGTAPDEMMAVGSQGLIACYDGHEWTRQRCPIRTALSSVFVESPDEAYACGPSSHALLKGSVYGWSQTAEHDAPIHGVAKYAGRVWLGAGRDGLMELSGSSIVSVQPDLKAVKFDARDALVISARDKVAQTTDGESFRWWTLDGVQDVLSEVETRWDY